jgi:S1-C subfamily serine protease
MGYPKVAQRLSGLLTSTGSFQSLTTGYANDNFVTFSNRIDGGYSGGPVLSMYGQVVAVITESTEQANGSDGQGGAMGIHFHGTPIEEVKTIL